MRKQALIIFVVLGLFTMLAVGTTTLCAQAARSIVVDVPFEFVVGRKTFPAGAYTFRRAARDSEKAWLVQRADAHEVAEVFFTGAVELSRAQSQTQTETRARLDFHRYDDQYFLSQIWTPGRNTGRQLPKTARERSVERELESRASRTDVARLVSTRQTVSIAAH